MAIPLEVLGRVECAGFSHRLLVADEGLRLLDHEDERSQVLDALSGDAPCLKVRRAWHRLLDRHVGSDRDDKLYLGIVETLMPDREFSDWYDEHLLTALVGASRFGNDDTALLLSLPEALRYALALQFVERTLAAGGIRDADRAQRLRVAVEACWASFVADGEPAPADRRRLVWDIRAHRWGGPT
jgi:hypothetical protein